MYDKRRKCPTCSYAFGNEPGGTYCMGCGKKIDGVPFEEVGWIALVADVSGTFKYDGTTYENKQALVNALGGVPQLHDMYTLFVFIADIHPDVGFCPLDAQYYDKDCACGEIPDEFEFVISSLD